MAVLFTIIFIVETIWLYFFGGDARLEKPFVIVLIAAIAAIWGANYVLNLFTVHPVGYMLLVGICIFFIMPTVLNLEK